MNNSILFNAAFSSIGGLLVGRWPISAVAIDYQSYVDTASAFATAVDDRIPAGAPSQQHADLLAAICSAVIGGRSLSERASASYEGVAATIAAIYTQAELSLLPVGGGGGAVSSVFGRAGAVAAVAGDYTSTQVDNSSAVVAGATVTAALDTLAASRQMRFDWWNSAAPATTSARFPGGRSISGLLTNARDTAPFIVPVATTARTLSFVSNFTALATDTVVATLQVSPVGGTTFADTALTLTVPAATTPGSLITASVDVPLNAGDQLAIKLVQSGTTAQASWFAAWSVYCQ